MNYDVRLRLSYEYEIAVSGGRHLVRVMPLSDGGVQRVIAASLSFDPVPAERTDRVDFFGNATTAISYEAPHQALGIDLMARINVDRPSGLLDMSPGLDALQQELAEVRALDGASPHHFRGESPRVAIDPDITAYAQESVGNTTSVTGLALDLCQRLYNDFAYDSEATLVDTSAREAFEMKRGVCQDFTHIMIAGLRGLGVPAAYVSGFLRTIPPAGGERLVGADAMHAWVRVWCGLETGWLEFDPTNAVQAGTDHIVIGYGRDYADVSPIVGVVKTSGDHTADQAVDVMPLD